MGLAHVEPGACQYNACRSCTSQQAFTYLFDSESSSCAEGPRALSACASSPPGNKCLSEVWIPPVGGRLWYPDRVSCRLLTCRTMSCLRPPVDSASQQGSYQSCGCWATLRTRHALHLWSLLPPRAPSLLSTAAARFLVRLWLGFGLGLGMHTWHGACAIVAIVSTDSWNLLCCICA